MANYRRLISYIYAYESGIKGKNVGFAKIENRKDQCRIQVSVRKVYVGSQDIGVYLMSTKGERLLGKMFIRGGAGEFRCMVQMDNGMSDCYGLTIHSIGDSWQSYTTIWEDAVAHAAEVDLSDAVSEKMEQKEMEQIPTDQIPEQPAPGNPVCQRSVAETIEAELEAEEQKVPWEEPEIPDVPPEPQLPPVPEILPNPPEPVPVTEPATEPEPVPVIEPATEPEPVPVIEPATEPATEPQPVTPQMTVSEASDPAPAPQPQESPETPSSAKTVQGSAQTVQGSAQVVQESAQAARESAPAARAAASAAPYTHVSRGRRPISWGLMVKISQPPL